MRTLSVLTSICAVAFLAGCAQPPRTLYMWQGYSRIQYDSLLREGATPQGQIQAMEAIAEKARGANSALPPGFRAHLGMLYLSEGNATAARQMWVAEKSAFPESASYMDYLLKRLDGSASPQAAAQPPLPPASAASSAAL